jgi:DNA-binding MarR family transcriptional regulator
MLRVSEVSDQIITTSRLLDQVGNLIMSEFGITMNGYETMILIDKNINTTTELANQTNSTLANITHKTKILEEKGYIRRNLGEDKRKWNFSLTSEGKELLESVDKYYDLATNRLFSQFTEVELQSMLGILNKTSQHLEFILMNETDLMDYVKSLRQKTRR